jgi:molybdate-binding protein/DNA-binding transcriptional regulator YhcF (GntR family)
VLLFQQIADSIRQQIVSGALKPGDSLPSVRAMSEQWGCAPGTVQRAYQELARQSLIATQVGQGSKVAAQLEMHTPLRRATLVNQIEAFMLGVLATGYTAQEIDVATHQVLDRWQASFENVEGAPREQVLRFVGSHDPIISLIAARFEGLVPHHRLQVTFVGSLGGLIALARQGADLAGSHLWDKETATYNSPYIRRLLPGRRVALITLAHRRLGLITPRGNPQAVNGLEDLARPGLRFINRQWGAGTRVWLDTRLEELGIRSGQIEGYDNTANTHLEVAGAVAEGQADVGLGVEAAALAYGLGFTLLTIERYDLVIPAEVWELEAIQTLARWLTSEEAAQDINGIGGYDTGQTGHVEWVG